MIYVAYFSWEGPEPEAKADVRSKGKFSCLVEADSVDEAGEKLWGFVADLKSWAAPFEDVMVVHLESVVEVEKLPERPVLAYFEELDYETGSTVFVSLPGVSPEFCGSYDYLHKDNDEEDEKGRITGPFVSFYEDADNPDPGSFRFS